MPRRVAVLFHKKRVADAAEQIVVTEVTFLSVASGVRRVVVASGQCAAECRSHRERRS